MRNLQSRLSIISTSNDNVVVRLVNQLIVRAEVLRSLCANSLDALAFYASWPSVTSGAKPRIRTALCFATVKQTQRRHHTMCHRHGA